MGTMKQGGPNPRQTDKTKADYTALSELQNHPTAMGIIGDADTLIGKGFERYFVQAEMEIDTAEGDFAYIGNRMGKVVSVTRNEDTDRIETITVREDLYGLPIDWKGQGIAFGYDTNKGSQKTTTFAIAKGIAAEVINGGGVFLSTGTILILKKRTEDKTTWTKEAQDAVRFQEAINPEVDPIDPIVSYNFDLTSPNWNSEGVTDEASFINWLANRSNFADNKLTNIVITDFNFEGDRIFCNMTADGTIYDLSDLGLVNADKIGVVNGLTNLYFAVNQIVTFNPTIALPSSLITLDLNGNQIVTFNPTIALPSGLTELNLHGNQMTLAGYTASEVWGTNQLSFTNNCSVSFTNNINSITGTNLEAILLTKNCVITA